MPRPKVNPIAGVYMIRCKVNGKVYIGCSGDIKRRWRTHKTQPSNKLLTNDFIKYGYDQFEFSILEVCQDKWHAEKRELYYMRLHNCFDPKQGYNVKANVWEI
jgi:group I intron endonuclease